MGLNSIDLESQVSDQEREYHTLNLLINSYIRVWVDQRDCVYLTPESLIDGLNHQLIMKLRHRETGIILYKFTETGAETLKNQIQEPDLPGVPETTATNPQASEFLDV